MPKLKLIIGTYNSISIGLTEAETETLYQNAFKPLLGLMYTFPELSFTLQYSGTLLAWLDKRHPEFTDVLSEMAARKQIELLGGAFHDPILTVIPRSDRLGQIENMTTYLRKRFGRRPRGGWLAETEWEPSLVSTLGTCGMDYIFLGENHFRSAGIPPADSFAPCITEDQGKTITVFPLFEDLSRRFCPPEPEEMLASLRALVSHREERLVTVLIDGALLGEGPGSRAACFDDKRIEHLFRLLRDAGDWLETIQPGRHLRQSLPRRKAYFPSGSRGDLLSLALPPEQWTDYTEARKILKNHDKAPNILSCNGFFRRFLTRYPESNFLYAKMQYTHILVNQIRGDKYRKASALEELWKGQNGAAYWPAPAGGIYDNALRKSAYASLISAEKVTRERGVFIPSIVTADFDMDLRTEYLYQGNEMNAYIHTLGGQLFELDFLPVSWNYLDTMARYREVFHGPGGDPRSFDSYSRRSFIDHVIPPGVTIDDFDASGAAPDWSFVDAPFDVIKCDREHSELVLEHCGPPGGSGGFPLKIVKKYIFKRASINLYYTVKNPGPDPVSLIFASEINLSFPSKDVDALRIYRPGEGESVPLSPEKMDLGETSGLLFEDVRNEAAISFSTLEPAEVWSMPVETLSPGREGLRKIYQSSCLLARWKLVLDPQESWENRLNLKMDLL